MDLILYLIVGIPVFVVALGVALGLAFWFGMFGMRCGFAVGEIIACIVRLRRVRNGDPVWEIATNIGGGIGFLVPFIFIMWGIFNFFLDALPR